MNRAPNSMHDNVVEKALLPRCSSCGGELRFSHREYAGRGLQAVIRRVVGAERGRRRQRPGIDEGAPPNPVLDAATARRLLGGGDEP
ncbi:MAG: hypothetical protein E6I33_04815 [Chloroflexi bacterium]|nr:MAG: hypothetical protein E6I33_04815 [Chloroflexota bacterium]